jgi:hypothetical protein
MEVRASRSTTRYIHPPDTPVTHKTVGNVHTTYRYSLMVMVSPRGAEVIRWNHLPGLVERLCDWVEGAERDASPFAALRLRGLVAAR